jgi:hypothetical protein
MTDAEGNVMAEEEITALHGHNDADENFGVECAGQSINGWDLGYYNVELTSEYEPEMGDVTISITNTLNSASDDESIGLGDIEINIGQLTAEVDLGEDDDEEGEAPEPIILPEAIPEVERELTMEDAEEPTLDAINAGDFESDGCQAYTQKNCGGMTYYGGRNECGRGSSFTKVIPMSTYEEASLVRFKAHIWAVDTWDDEQVFVRLKDEDGNVIGE